MGPNIIDCRFHQNLAFKILNITLLSLSRGCAIPQSTGYWPGTPAENWLLRTKIAGAPPQFWTVPCGALDSSLFDLARLQSVAASHATPIPEQLAGNQSPC